MIQVERGTLDTIPVSGWHCEIAVDGGGLRQLRLTADALFKLFSELALQPQIRAIRLSMARCEEEVTA